MPNDVAPVPPGYHTVTPYLTVRNAVDALAFWTEAFGAKEVFRLVGPDGRIGHAEIRIGDSLVMVSDEYPDFGALGPASLGGSPVKFHLYVPDADAATARAVAAGASLLRPVETQPWGIRSGMVADPFGHSWFIATQVEDVTPTEMQRRWDAGMGG
jgi:PhnB protein